MLGGIESGDVLRGGLSQVISFFRCPFRALADCCSLLPRVETLGFDLMSLQDSIVHFISYASV